MKNIYKIWEFISCEERVAVTLSVFVMSLFSVALYLILSTEPITRLVTVEYNGEIYEGELLTGNTNSIKLKLNSGEEIRFYGTFKVIEGIKQ
jgi:hypothetical protein